MLAWLFLAALAVVGVHLMQPQPSSLIDGPAYNQDYDYGPEEEDNDTVAWTPDEDSLLGARRGRSAPAIRRPFEGQRPERDLVWQRRPMETFPESSVTRLCYEMQQFLQLLRLLREKGEKDKFLELNSNPLSIKNLVGGVWEALQPFNDYVNDCFLNADGPSFASLLKLNGTPLMHDFVDHVGRLVEQLDGAIKPFLRRMRDSSVDCPNFSIILAALLGQTCHLQRSAYQMLLWASRATTGHRCSSGRADDDRSSRSSMSSWDETPLLAGPLDGGPMTMPLLQDRVNVLLGQLRDRDNRIQELGVQLLEAENECQGLLEQERHQLAQLQAEYERTHGDAMLALHQKQATLDKEQLLLDQERDQLDSDRTQLNLENEQVKQEKAQLDLKADEIRRLKEELVQANADAMHYEALATQLRGQLDTLHVQKDDLETANAGLRQQVQQQRDPLTPMDAQGVQCGKDGTSDLAGRFDASLQQVRASISHTQDILSRSLNLEDSPSASLTASLEAPQHADQLGTGLSDPVPALMDANTVANMFNENLRLATENMTLEYKLGEAEARCRKLVAELKLKLQAVIKDKEGLQTRQAELLLQLQELRLAYEAREQSLCDLQRAKDTHVAQLQQALLASEDQKAEVEQLRQTLQTEHETLLGSTSILKETIETLAPMNHRLRQEVAVLRQDLITRDAIVQDVSRKLGILSAKVIALEAELERKTEDSDLGRFLVLESS